MLLQQIATSDSQSADNRKEREVRIAIAECSGIPEPSV
jgi:hypothetical protein